MIRPGQAMPLVNVYRNFRRYLDKANISHTGHGPRVHDFRHTYCVNLLRKWYRQKGATSSAANQRLAAIKTFADYAQLECIEYISLLQGVTAIKAKKSSPKEVLFLSVEQVSQLINRPDINTPTGLRHRVILTLLYDSGCRVQELCDLTIADIFLGENPTV